jgi:predicted MFS family arabinose efflux permease
MDRTAQREHDGALRALVAAAFLIFFNGYLIAPLIPTLARELGKSEQQIGLIVPAYMLTYGFSTLFYGPLSDRVGRRRVLLFLLALSALSTFACAFAWSASSLIALRILCGLCAGGIVPISLALVGDIYPFHAIGRPLGWIFGAIAGGMSFGSTLGAWLNPYLGWRNELIVLAVAGTVVLFAAWRAPFPNSAPRVSPAFRAVLETYLALLCTSRGARTYGLIFLNGLFHSGIFSWLGFYLFHRYALSDPGIGKALLGYGLPGMVLGPILGRAADRYGRRRIVPAGLLLAAGCAFALVPHAPLWSAVIVITLLSVGFDMTHPLLAGIVSTLDPPHRGQAMGLNAFAVFTGFGFGALAFQLLLIRGIAFALLVFAATQTLLALFASRFFPSE